MNIRLTILLAAISCLAACASLTHTPATGRAGEMSSWGIVYSPCAWCGATNNTEVHHIYPQHLWPERARDTNNMVCLCRTGGKGCHFYIGHHGISWRYIFTNVIAVIKEGRK